MCLDKGYDYDEVYAILREFGSTAHVHPRGEEAKAIKREAGFKARRWVMSVGRKSRRIIWRFSTSPVA